MSSVGADRVGSGNRLQYWRITLWMGRNVNGRSPQQGREHVGDALMPSVGGVWIRTTGLIWIPAVVEPVRQVLPGCRVHVQHRPAVRLHDDTAQGGEVVVVEVLRVVVSDLGDGDGLTVSVDQPGACHGAGDVVLVGLWGNARPRIA